MVKLTGYYQLPGAMPVQVDFQELFDTGFMRKYTRYRSFDKFLQGSKMQIRSQQDFEDLPEEIMDAHVQKNTRFRSWKEMIDTATDMLVRRKMQKG